MVVDFHDDYRRHAAFPGVVPESLAQGMAGCAVFEVQRFGGRAYDPVGLNAADGIAGIWVPDQDLPPPG